MTNLHIPALEAANTDTVSSAASTPISPSASSAQTATSPTLRNTKKIVIGVSIAFAIIVGARTIANLNDAKALAQTTAASLQRTVIITKAKPGALTNTLLLPTTLRGNNETSIYARANGYLTTWHKDIGDIVKQGDVLATLTAPEQEQELAQARAALQQIKARADLAHLTAQRWESLRAKDGVSQHDLEEKRSEALQASADFAAADANVKRLEELRSLRRIVAPFSGVIARRDIQVGDLVSAGSTELFSLTQTDPLRLSIWVPQLNAGNIQSGKQVTIEIDNQRFAATVDRVAGGIDTQTRARQVDLILPNSDGKLLPGAYAQARIELTNSSSALVAPSSVLKTTAEGFKVAVVDKDDQIAFRDIKIGRDLGRQIEILDGISSDDTLVLSPSDLLAEGETVKTMVWEEKSKAGDKSKDGKKSKDSEKEKFANDKLKADGASVSKS